MSGRTIVIMRTLSNEIKKVGEQERDNKKLPAVVREVMGNLRFPLDKTYHGCPQNSRTRPGYGPSLFGNRLVRTRMLGGVGTGGEKPPATRLDHKQIIQTLRLYNLANRQPHAYRFA